MLFRSPVSILPPATGKVALLILLYIAIGQGVLKGAAGFIFRRTKDAPAPFFHSIPCTRPLFMAGERGKLGSARRPSPLPAGTNQEETGTKPKTKQNQTGTKPEGKGKKGGVPLPQRSRKPTFARRLLSNDGQMPADCRELPQLAANCRGNKSAQKCNKKQQKKGAAAFCLTVGQKTLVFPLPQAIR